MKFTKQFDCKNCSLKCDIYEALNVNNAIVEQLETVRVRYKRHEIICKQGKEVTHAIYLVSGLAKLYIEGLNNRNIILYILTPNSYIGLLSFFETPVYNYTVSALEDVEVCLIDLNLVKKLYVENHNLLIKLNKAFGKSVASIMKKIITLNQKNLRGRIADSLLYLSELNNNDTFNLYLTRKELGELSATSEENAVRILSEFKNENIINIQGKQITIIDKMLLKKISEIG